VERAVATGGGYKIGDILPDGRIAGMGPGAALNNQAAREAANALKYKPVNGAPFNAHGQPVFKKGNDYISPDVDQHSGGVWKMFDQKGRRLGTFDGNLNRIGK
jgi:filamentous hemagglutinin